MINVLPYEQPPVEGSIPSSSSNEKAKPTKRVLINGGFDLLYSEGRIE